MYRSVQTWEAISFVWRGDVVHGMKTIIKSKTERYCLTQTVRTKKIICLCVWGERFVFMILIHFHISFSSTHCIFMVFERLHQTELNKQKIINIEMFGNVEGFRCTWHSHLQQWINLYHKDKIENYSVLRRNSSRQMCRENRVTSTLKAEYGFSAFKAEFENA